MTRSEEYEQREHEAYKRWSETTQFFKIDQLDEVVNRPDCYLPTDEGFLVTALLQSVDELKSFVLKFDNIAPFVEYGYVELIAQEGDECWSETFHVDGELMSEEYTPVPEKEDLAVLVVNQYFEEDRVVQLTQREVERYRDDQIVWCDKATSLNFPVFARVYLLDTFDRTGDVTIKQIEFHELNSYKTHPIQIW